MSIKQILTKAWEDCKQEGVELDKVSFHTNKRLSEDSYIYEIEYSGSAIEKSQPTTIVYDINKELAKSGRRI